MPQIVNDVLNVSLRWIHVVTGILWIGHLYFFNFVNAQLVKTYDADSKKKVVPELMPRALYWFRWGAAWTWITGVLLLGIVYYMSVIPAAKPAMSIGAITSASLAILVIGFLVYDMLWKSPLGKNETVAGAVSFVLVVGLAYVLNQIMDGRSAFIHMGATFGTIMAGNVWMRIWPSQRKIIAGIKGTAPAPDASVPAMAALRSKHNTYMSVPLVFMMVSNHYPTIYGCSWNWLLVAGFVAVGWAATKWMYMKSAGPAPAAF